MPASMRCPNCGVSNLVEITDVQGEGGAYTLEWDCPACGQHATVEHHDIKKR